MSTRGSIERLEIMEDHGLTYMRADPEGEYVRWEDVEHLLKPPEELPTTRELPTNADFCKLVQEVLDTKDIVNFQLDFDFEDGINCRANVMHIPNMPNSYERTMKVLKFVSKLHRVDSREEESMDESQATQIANKLTDLQANLSKLCDKLALVSARLEEKEIKL